MKIRVLMIGLLLATRLSLPAQVVVEVTLQQNQFLPGEALPATVRVINRSGRTLQLGAEEDWLTFAVQGREGVIVRKNGEAPVLGEVALESSKVASKKVDLAPYFALTRPGRYNIIATVRIKEWEALASSAPKIFDIIDGTKIWTQEFGVPVAGSSSEPPEVRRYALLQANYLRSELRLYFQLTDGPGSKVMKVFALGSIVSFGHPEAAVDGQSRLHVLQQNNAHASRYTVVDPDGEVVLRQTYEYTESRPRLMPDKTGKIVVAGAVRRPDQDDLPAPKTAD